MLNYEELRPSGVTLKWHWTVLCRQLKSWLKNQRAEHALESFIPSFQLSGVDTTNSNCMSVSASIKGVLSDILDNCAVLKEGKIGRVHVAGKSKNAPESPHHC